MNYLCHKRTNIIRCLLHEVPLVAKFMELDSGPVAVGVEGVGGRAGV